MLHEMLFFVKIIDIFYMSITVTLLILKYYVYLIRLTPTYAIVIGFYATLFYHLGSGPKWDTWVGKNSDYCRKNWWTNLLYINNYINLDATVRFICIFLG